MKLRDILSSKGGDVVTIEDCASVLDSIRLLNKHKIGALLILDSAGRTTGIITERDILHLCDSELKSFDQLNICDAMKKDLIIGVPDDDVEYAMGVMTKNRIRHLPVMDDERLVGMISIGDLVKSRLEAMEYENRYLRQYIAQS